MNLPLGGHFPSTTVGHGAAGPVAIDPTMAFQLVDANGLVAGAVCQGKPVLVQATWGLLGEPRAYFLTASDNAVTFTSNNSTVSGSLGAEDDPNKCTNRVYYKTTIPIAAPPLLAQNASTIMTIPCGTSGPTNLTITTAKGRGMQHLQGTTLVNSVPCGCADALGGAPGNVTWSNETSSNTTTPGVVPNPSTTTEGSSSPSETAPGATGVTGNDNPGTSNGTTGGALAGNSTTTSPPSSPASPGGTVVAPGASPLVPFPDTPITDFLTESPPPVPIPPGDTHNNTTSPTLGSGNDTSPHQSPSSPVVATLLLSSPPPAGGNAGLGLPTVVGISVGVAVPALLGVAAVAWWAMKRRQASSSQVSSTNAVMSDPAVLTKDADVKISLAPGISSRDAAPRPILELQPPVGTSSVPGLLPGDVFLRATAHQYTWTQSTALSQPVQALEAGVNDSQLDSLGGSDGSCAVLQLSSQEVQQQVQLLSDGLLGRGATALVFRAVWPSRFGRSTVLAAKVVKDGYEAAIYDSFMYEATVLASLQHPNIVRMYGYCLEPPTVCLLLELLPISLKDLLYRDLAMPSLHYTASTQGTSQDQGSRSKASSTCASNSGILGMHAFAGSIEAVSAVAAETVQQVQQQRRHLTCHDMVSLATGIAGGLSYLHNSVIPSLTKAEKSPHSPAGPMTCLTDRGRVVHRDLKPANILISSKGVPKISDFGLARQHDHTTIGTIHLGVGTLPYMAPELLEAAAAGTYAQAPTNLVDVYSLGIMLWEMATGVPPWQSLGELAILAAVTKGQRPPLPADESSAPDAVSASLAETPARPFPAFNAIIRSCWQQRELRRPTAAVVHNALMQLLGTLEMSYTSP